MKTKTMSSIKKKDTGKKSTARVAVQPEENRDISRAFLHHLYFTQGRTIEMATTNDLYMALAQTVRDQLLERWLHTVQNYNKPDVRIVSYLSAEFLMGPHLENNLINLGIYDQARLAMEDLGLDFNNIIEQEEEPGLGNGGLGRLAACYLDSLATLEIPAVGYGIRYEFGIFDQVIRDGWQIEITDQWLRPGNPWEIHRPDLSYNVKLVGHTESYYDEKGRYCVRWIPGREIKGIAYDTPIAGYRVNTCNTLRLWKAEAIESFDFQDFNVGDYYGAVNEKVVSETVTKVLYPNDEPEAGKRLRLAQQYFFVSCSLQDMMRFHLLLGGAPETFHEKIAIQLNDTHPSIAVAELMRLLVDEYHIEWDKAWQVTRNTFGYTNHTLLPEALEKWPLTLFGGLLPRHLEIIYEINKNFLDDVRLKYPGDDYLISRLSLIDEHGERYVRMAHLASVGSHAINGVAELHSDLLKKDVLRDFYELMPENFLNVTNGVTPRRFLVVSNPKLSALISSRIGEAWITNLQELRGLESFAADPLFQKEWQMIKRENKQVLADLIQKRTGIAVEPDSLFDIQAKRIHEYKRQHLNVLHIITLYNRIKNNSKKKVVPRTFIFGGKAAPGYFMAKLMIRLINGVGEVINNDPDVAGRLKVVFFPDFNVKNARYIYPAADLSEQISTAGKEASGTGNMKFSLNGALTIGTLDGANIEIREEVGADNFFLFGLTAEQVYKTKAKGYNPKQYYGSDSDLRETIDQISSGTFSRGDRNLFKPLVDSLLYGDPYMLFADYRAYLDSQEQVSTMYRDRAKWTRMAILNVARMGKFSSDRSIKDYCDKIWDVHPFMVELGKYKI
ncbi:glycogen phosphorylase [uncultured Desulfobacterium sp.]|uniref:Alpha-1,4 glucan phosphorylase n=1 Tax=uncultured Desulfobacterium sp. TaxID=201089 RepID=A0A445N1K5_9BACT|nr:glycogen phosphorylase [uncultured Desulfobacterium sp.]